MRMQTAMVALGLATGCSAAIGGIPLPPESPEAIYLPYAGSGPADLWTAVIGLNGLKVYRWDGEAWKRVGFYPDRGWMPVAAPVGGVLDMPEFLMTSGGPGAIWLSVRTRETAVVRLYHVRADGTFTDRTEALASESGQTGHLTGVVSGGGATLVTVNYVDGEGHWTGAVFRAEGDQLVRTQSEIASILHVRSASEYWGTHGMGGLGRWDGTKWNDFTGLEGRGGLDWRQLRVAPDGTAWMILDLRQGAAGPGTTVAKLEGTAWQIQPIPPEEDDTSQPGAQPAEEGSQRLDAIALSGGRLALLRARFGGRCTQSAWSDVEARVWDGAALGKARTLTPYTKDCAGPAWCRLVPNGVLVGPPLLDGSTVLRLQVSAKKREISGRFVLVNPADF